VAGPVIQATGRSEFEDGLGSGDFVLGYTYYMSVRTRLSDHGSNHVDLVAALASCCNRT
jgi:hypothetical protein